MNLTSAECNKIIQKKLNSSDFKILDIKLTPLDTRNGFFGEHYRLLIQIQQNGTEQKQINCFAKFIPENPTQAEFAITCGVFRKEIFIYNKLLPLFEDSGINFIKSVAPECYYTKDDFVLVFEDVTRNDYKPLSKYGYLDYDHVLVTIKSMVKLHAASLIYEEKQSLKIGKKYRLTDDFHENFYETFYVDRPEHKGGQATKAALKGLLTGFNIYFPELINEKFRALHLDIFNLIKPSTKFRNCVCHGDLWSTNIMIKYNDSNKPVDCLLIDFQTVRYCPPGQDFMTFIFLTTTRDFRRKYLEQLQQIYYQELMELLGESFKVISFDEFLESCAEQVVFAAIQNVLHVQLTQLKEENVTAFMQDQEMWDEALYVDRSKMMKFCCETDENYRRVFLEALQNVADIFA